MLTVLVSLAALACLILGADLLGRRIAAQHLAVVRARYGAAPDTVWALVSDPLGAAAWRTDLVGVDRVPSSDGTLRWRERSKRRAIEFVALPSIAGVHFATKIAQDDLPFAGQWDYEISPDGAGTLLAITERGEIRPALFRLLARHAFGYTRALESYHRSLAARLGEEVRLEIINDGR